MMDGWITLISSIFGSAGIIGAITGLAKYYRGVRVARNMAREAELEKAREEGRNKLLQEQATATIQQLKAELTDTKSENIKLWSLIDRETAS